MTRRRTSLILAIITAVTLVVPATALAAPAACGITWGSTPKIDNWGPAAPLTDIRSGTHDCYDRLVFDFRAPVTGHHVSYVDNVYHDASGELVPLRGGAKLQVVVGGPAYDENFNPTYHPADRTELVNVTGYQTFRQASWAGSFEGTTTVGLGVRAQLPFRVFYLPNRIVLDVAHVW